MDVWLEKTIRGAEGNFIEIVCPYLVDKRCSIYAKRPSCCRNFPMKKGYCSDSDCILLKKDFSKNSELASKECLKCKKLCCEGIVVPANVELSKENIFRLLDMSCKDCQVLFKKRS